MNYIVRAALTEETNNGWVWICGPSLKDLESRTIVKISRPRRWRCVYTEVRRIDGNFCHQYNSEPRISIDCELDTIVIAEWYRGALAIRNTTNSDNKTDTVPLVIREPKIWGWKSLRVASHHPDPVVRLGTRLGVLGAWLGLLGVWLGILSVGQGLPCRAWLTDLVWCGIVALVVSGSLGVWACMGPPRPRLN